MFEVLWGSEVTSDNLRRSRYNKTEKLIVNLKFYQLKVWSVQTQSMEFPAIALILKQIYTAVSLTPHYKSPQLSKTNNHNKYCLFVRNFITKINCSQDNQNNSRGLSMVGLMTGTSL